MPTHKTVTT